VIPQKLETLPRIFENCHRTKRLASTCFLWLRKVLSTEIRSHVIPEKRVSEFFKEIKFLLSSINSLEKKIAEFNASWKTILNSENLKVQQRLIAKNDDHNINHIF